MNTSTRHQVVTSILHYGDNGSKQDWSTSINIFEHLYFIYLYQWIHGLICHQSDPSSPGVLNNFLLETAAHPGSRSQLFGSRLAPSGTSQLGAWKRHIRLGGLGTFRSAPIQYDLDCQCNARTRLFAVPPRPIAPFRYSYAHRLLQNELPRLDPTLQQTFL